MSDTLDDDDDDEFLEFLEIFKEESLGRLVNVSRALDALEGGVPPDERAALLDETDRELHTIKGSARLLGFGELGALVHDIEGLARRVREHPAMNLDLLVECSDRLSGLVLEASEAAEDRSDDELRARVRAVLAEPIPDASPGLGPRGLRIGPGGQIIAQRTPPKPARPAATEPSGDAAARHETPPHGGARPTPFHEEVRPIRRPRDPHDRDASRERPGSDERTPLPAAALPSGETTISIRSGAANREESDRTRSDGARPRSRETRPVRQEDETVRVRASRLAQLDEIVSELTLARQRLETYEKRMGTLVRSVDEGHVESTEVSQTLRRLVQEFHVDTLQVQTATKDLQRLAVDVRLRPVAYLFDHIPREARQLARKLGKRVQVRIRGEDTEMDRVILDQLRSPLIHLLRNSLDHGIEAPEDRVHAGKPPEGTLELSAGQEGNRVVIRLRDDGAGIDPGKVRAIAIKRGVLDPVAAAQLPDDDAIQLIFAPGFSTRDVTTELSGRGVGMNAVRTAVESLKGDVGVSSSEGRGTEITIHLPLTLLISRVTLVRTGGQRFALPTESVVESVRLPVERVIDFAGRATMLWRQRSIPLVRLNSFLGRQVLPDPPFLRVLVVHHAGDWLALVVEELLEERSVVVKPLGWPLELVPWVSGAVHTPSGEIALQVHVPEVFAQLRSGAARFERAPTEQVVTNSILVVDDSTVSRERVGRVLDALGFEPLMAVDGVDAWGILERVRPLIIVTDLEMPRVDGLTLIRRVRSTARLRDIPIVIISNRASQQDRRDGLEAGADAYLAKGEFNPVTFREILERML